MSSVINETLLAIKAAFEAGVNIFNGGTAVSSSNPLPVAQTDGLAVSGTVIGTAANQATSGIATVLFATSMLNYESITVQVTSAGTSCTIVVPETDNPSVWATGNGLLELTAEPPTDMPVPPPVPPPTIGNPVIAIIFHPLFLVIHIHYLSQTA